MNIKLSNITFCLGCLFFVGYLFARGVWGFSYLTESQFIGVILIVAGIDVFIRFFCKETIYIGPVMRASVDDKVLRKICFLLGLVILFLGFYFVSM